MSLLIVAIALSMTSLTSSSQQTRIVSKAAKGSARKQMPQTYQPPTIEQLHEVLRNTSGPHDTYLAIPELGTKETVPLLLERMRLDYGASEPTPPPPGLVAGFVCTHAHLVRALGLLTNTDQGMYYPKWALLIAAFSENVETFDIRNKRPLWKRRIAFRPDHLLITRDRILLGSESGELIGMNRYGRRIWRTGSNSISRLVPDRSDVFVVGDKAVERLDPNTGAVTSKFPAASIRDADFAQGLAFVVNENGLHRLQNNAEPERQMSRAIALSVTPRSVCVTNGGYREGDDNRVTCFAPDTLAPQWTRPISRNGTWGHDIAPVQSGFQVFVPTDYDHRIQSV